MKRRLFSAGVILVFALAASACGGSKNGGGSSSDAAKKLPGAKVFASAGCAGCHTLKVAGAKGQVGPNLDELKPDESTVERQVRAGGNGMPPFGRKLSARQIAQVAAFVSSASKSSKVSLAFKPDQSTIADCEHSREQGCTPPHGPRPSPRAGCPRQWSVRSLGIGAVARALERTAFR